MSSSALTSEVDSTEKWSIDTAAYEEVGSQSDSAMPEPEADEADLTAAVTENAVADESVQCTLLQPSSCRFSHLQLIDEPGMLRFYTGFENYEHFRLFFTILGPAVYSLRPFSSLPDVKDQLLLTLIKLRCAKEDTELAFMFKICRSTVGLIFHLWINFMYFQLNELQLWPDGEVIESHMSQNFGRLFPKTKLILDATEIPIEKPGNVEAQSITFSTYKNQNTV